jgi:hypothetical protein
MYSLKELQYMNKLKHRIKDLTDIITPELEAFPRTFLEASIEVHEVQHEVEYLLQQLQVHGLWPILDAEDAV